MEETNRQKKIAGLLQKDIAEVIQEALREAGVSGILVSVTKVRITTDLSVSKVYLSVFPHAESNRILTEINMVKSQIKHQVAQRTRNQLRKVPNFQYFIDDSLEYIDEIDRSIKGEQNPIEDPSLLERRKKK